jgi:hypothetical protein
MVPAVSTGRTSATAPNSDALSRLGCRQRRAQHLRLHVPGAAGTELKGTDDPGLGSRRVDPPPRRLVLSCEGGLVQVPAGVILLSLQ